MQVATRSHVYECVADPTIVPLKHVHVQFAHCCMFPQPTTPLSDKAGS
jgi:hypothetical protein